MSVHRTGSTPAKRGSLESLQDFLPSGIPLIKSSQGCESVTLYQSYDDPARFTVIEVWESIESHQGAGGR